MNMLARTDYTQILLKEDAKRSFENNYLAMLFEKHKALPQSEIVEFIHKAQQTGANPSLNQIYLIERSIKDEKTSQWRKTGTTVFSYNFLQAVANQVGGYQGYTSQIKMIDKFDVTEFKAKPMLACEVIVTRNGNKFPYTAYWDEYVVLTKDKVPNAIWGGKPYMMLEKCALAGAMRRAYPEAMSGMYIEEEMEAIDNELNKNVVNDAIETKALEKAEIKAEKEDRVVFEDIGEIHKTMNDIKAIMSEIADGQTALEKGKLMRDLLGVTKFDDIKSKYTLNELKELLVKVCTKNTERLAEIAKQKEILKGK